MRLLNCFKYYVPTGVFMVYLLALMSISMANTGKIDLQTLHVGSKDFEIPGRYLENEGLTQNWYRWLPRLDSGTRELLLTIPASEVAAAISGFQPKDGEYIDNLRLRLVILNDEERQRHLDQNKFTDIWNGADSYKDRVIELDPDLNLFRIYRKIEYPYSWELFSSNPQYEKMPADIFFYWYGHCLRSHSPLTKSGFLSLCKSYAVIDNIAVHFTTSSQNISLAKQIRTYVRQLVMQWKKDPTVHRK